VQTAVRVCKCAFSTRCVASILCAVVRALNGGCVETHRGSHAVMHSAVHSNSLQDSQLLHVLLQM
jgi:hypothetical protein